MFIIAQVKEKCNDEFSMVGMAQVIQTLQDGGRLNDLIAVEVLKGSNEKALDFLRVCGCEAIVPGTMFAPLIEIAKFYQCSPSYLRTVLNRAGITPAKTPADVMKCGFSHFMRHFDLEKRFCVHSRYSTHTMIDRETNQKYEFTHSDKAAGNFYSARVVLALAMLMYFGRVVNPDATGSEIHKQLLRSTYYDAAQRGIAERKARQQAESHAAADVKPDTVPDNNTAVMSEGKVIMTADFLAGIIKAAVQEAIAEVSKTIVPAVSAVAAPPTAKTEPGYTPSGHPVKMTKPDNWDIVLAKYESGAITRTDAASQVRMSVGSFDNYRKGRRQFLS